MEEEQLKEQLKEVSKKYVNRRKGHRATVTTKIRTLEKLLKEVNLDEAKLLAIKGTLAEKTETLRELNEKILENIEETNFDESDDDPVSKEICDSTEWEDKIFEASYRIDLAIDKMRGDRDSDTSTSSKGSGSKGKSNIKLPKMHLKKFQGDPKNWVSWKDSFDSAIHNNEALEDIDKFNYLKAFLGEVPLAAIKGLTLSSANYDRAYDSLCERFGNKQSIISSHMRALLEVKEISTSNDVKAIRALYDTVEANVQSLKSLGVHSENYGSMLLPVILAKLPSDLRLIISRTYDTAEAEWKIEELLVKFRSEVQARERCEYVSMDHTEKKKSNDGLPTAAALAAHLREEPFCDFCKKTNHMPQNCKTVTKPEARRSILLKEGKCFVCLAKGHITSKCKLAKKCGKCEKMHHVSLCGAFKKVTRQKKTENGKTGKPDSESTETSSSGEKGTQDDENQDSKSMLIDAKDSVLLQTATERCLIPNALRMQ